MNIVAVTFDSRDGYHGYSSQSKHYHYKTDLDLKVGDQCVVDTPCGIRNATKWIVSKVDRSRYLARIEAEAELRDLNAQLSIELEKAAIAEQRRLLAERYPAIGELVKRIEGLEATLGSFQG